MSRFPAHSLTRAFLFLFLLASTAALFAQGAKPADSAKDQHAATPKTKHHSSAKQSKSGNSKHIISPEQREKIAEEMQESKRAHDHPAEAEKFYLSRRLAKGQNHLPVEKYLAAKEQMKSMHRYDSGLGRFLTQDEHLQNQQLSAAIASGVAAPTNTANLLTSWQFLGPDNIGGRTRAIIIDPTNSQVMYSAAVAGGVWKSTDGGAHWNPLDDMMANIAVNSLAMDPNDPLTLYAGTGEGYFNLDAIRGAGIFKTTDGGVNWTALANTVDVNNGFARVQKIVVSKGNSQHVYAATRNGIFRSTDGGTNWTQVLLNQQNVNGCMDLAIRTDITASDWVIASCGTFTQQATVYVNQDAANTTNWVSKLSELEMGRTSLAIAPSNQLIVYAAAADSGVNDNYVNGLWAIFHSADGGLTWAATVRNTDPILLNTLLFTNPVFAQIVECGLGNPGDTDSFNNQGWYDNVIAVDPADATKVYVGGIDLFRSDDSGANWKIMSYWWFNTTDPHYTHADHHAIAFDPGYNGTSNQIMYVGDDGGMQKTTNARAATSTDICGGALGGALPAVTWSNLNHTYGVTQFYDGSVSPDGNTYLAGAQDNGTDKGTSASTSTWSDVHGGDGGYTAIDQTTPTTMYSEFTGLSIQKSTNSGASWADAVNGILEDPNDFPFITTFVMDPANSQILWTGAFKIWRTTNGGASWSQAASNILNGGVSAIGIAKSAHGTVLVGDGSGIIIRTTSGTTTTAATAWTSVQASNGGTISGIAFDPTNANIAFATVSTFGFSHVLKSTNGGQSWVASDNSGNPNTSIPDIPANAVIVDPVTPTTVYVGTDMGVFVSLDSGATWSVENTNFANVPVDAFRITGGNLYAFTHGRSAWRVPLVPNPKDFTNVLTNSPLTVFAGAPLNVSGTLTAILGYNSAVALTCTAGGTAVPSTCTKTPVGTVTPTALGAAYNMSVTNTTAGDFSFNVHAVGTDTAHKTHDAPAVVHVVDFTLGNVTPALGNVNKGASVDATFDVTSLNGYAGALTLSCGSLPLNTSCTFAGTGVSGNVLTLSAGDTVTVTATIAAAATATAATTNITFKAAATIPSAVTKTSTNYALTVNNVVANADLSIVGDQSPANTVTTGNVTYNLTVANAGPDKATAVTVTSNSPAGYTFVSATPSAGTCNAALPISCNLGNLNNADSQTIAVVLTPATGTGSLTFTVASGTADNTAPNNIKTFSTVTPDYTLTAAAPSIVFPSQPFNLTGTATASNGYSSLVNLSCSPAFDFGGSAGTCTPGSVTPGAAAPFTLATTAPSTVVGAGTITWAVEGVGTDPYTATHTVFPATTHVVDFIVGALSSTSANINLGSSANASFTVQSSNLSFAPALTLSCPGLPANGITCSFSGTGVTGNTLNLPGGATVTVFVHFQSTAGVGDSTSTPTTIQIDASAPAVRTKNTATFTVNLSSSNARADLSIGAVTQSPVNPVTSFLSGTTVTYTFTVTNLGPDPAHNVVVNYDVPVGYIFVAAGSGPSCTGTINVVCNAGTINSGASANFTIKANPALIASQLMTFTASADEGDTVPGNNLSTTTTLVKDFDIGPRIIDLVIPQAPAGQSSAVTVPVTITGLNGFNTSTALSCIGQPVGVTCAFSPASVIPNAIGVNSTLTVTAASTAIPGHYFPAIKGAAGTLAHGRTFFVTIGAHSFTQVVTPTTQNVIAGSSAAYTVVYTPLAGMTEDIAVGCGALPAGVTCIPIPPVVTPGVTPGNKSIVALQTTFGTTPGANATVVISGVSPALNNLTRSTNVTLSVKDFTVTANTATITTNVGSNITDTILVKGLNGFTGNVALGCVIVGTPVGTNCTLSNVNPAATAAGTSVTATITSTAATTPAGSYAVQVTGTTLGGSKMASFTVNIKDFTLATGAGAITIPQPPAGQSSSLTIPVTLTALNGYNTSTALSCTGQPTGITCAFSPASGIPTIGGLHSTLTVTSTSTVLPNTYHLQVKAAAGTLIRLQTLDVSDFGPNFTQAVTPITQNVTSGSSTAYTVTYTPLGGMTLPIDVTCGALPAGVTCTPVPAQIIPGTTALSSVVTLQTTFGTTPAANSTVAISGTNAGLGISRSNNVTLSVKDFTVTANTAIIATNVGTNITDTILVKGLNGFTGNVGLGCVIVGSPTGMGCNLSNANPAASAAGTSVTATITSTAATTPAGSYAVQVTGTTLGGSKMASFTVNIKDFTLATGAGAITIPQPPAGQSSSLTIPVTLTALNGYNTSTALSCTGQPTGITCAFSPASGIPTIGGLHSTLTVTSTSTVLPNTYHLQVKAAAGTLIRLQALDVSDFGPNFTQAVAPATQNVTAGASVPYTVTYTPLGGMTLPIDVTCGALPAGVTCTAVPAQVIPGTTALSSIVTLQTTFGTTPAANSTVAITGNSAAISVTRSNNVTLSVKDFTVTANTPIIATNVGANITDTIVVKGLNGFTGNVALGCVIVGSPAGMGCNLSNASPAASAAGTSVTATITSTVATTPAGSYTVQVTGTNSAQSHMAQFTVNIKTVTLGVSPSTQSLPFTGGQTNFTVTTTALNGFASAVTLSCATPMPTGLTCGFGATNTATLSVTPSGAGTNTNLRVTVASGTSVGLKNLTVKATSGTTLTLTNPISVDVTASAVILSGTYSAVTYGYDSGPVTQPSLQTNIPSTPFAFSVSQQPPTGFKSQFATISFDGAGNYTMSQQQNQDGTGTSSGPIVGTYAVANDGSVTLDGGAVVAGHVNATGSNFVLDQQAGHFPNIVIGVKNSITSLSNASLSGAYSVVTYGYDSGPVTQPSVQTFIASTPFNFDVPQTPPTGFKSQFATITFNGSGAYTMSQQQNLDGTGSSSGPQNGTYAVASNGTVTLDGGSVVAGHLNANGSAFLLDQKAGHFPNIVVGVKNGTGAMSNASLSGAYSVVTYGYDSGLVTQPSVQTNIPSTPFDFNVSQQPPPGFKSQFTTITFDGAGNYSMSQQQNLDGTESSSGPQVGTYAVASNGSVTLDGGSVVSGHLNADGSTFLLDQQAGHFPNIVVGIKN